MSREAREYDASDRLQQRGLSPIAVLEGTIGSGARAIGAACLPLLANFARDRGVLFKELAPVDA